MAKNKKTAPAGKKSNLFKRLRRLVTRAVAILLLLGILLGLGWYFLMQPQGHSRLTGVLSQIKWPTWLPQAPGTGSSSPDKPTATVKAPTQPGKPPVSPQANRSAESPKSINYAGAPKPQGNISFEVLVNQAYMVGYSEDRKNPLWVSYRAYRTTPGPAPKRSDKFQTDRRTKAMVSTADFTGTGYDRGHMAPSRVIGLLYGAEAQDETFLMTNIAPQKKELNRGIWRALENMEYDKLAVNFEEIWVTTGPTFEGSVRALPSGVHIPTSFYKTFIDEQNGAPRAISFIIPQEVKGDENLKMFLTSVRQLEDLTGLDFNPLMPKPLQDKVESAIPQDLW